LSSPAKRLLIMLVSQPGVVHNTLYSMLQSLPDVNVLDAAGALTAYTLIKQQAVEVVVIDANLPVVERATLIGYIKQVSPQTKCLVLTATSRHHDLLWTAGADGILHQNCSLQEVETAVFSP